VANLVNLRYVGPHDAYHIPALALSVKSGEVVTVSDATAGAPPSPDGSDLGSGLLAQSDIWQLVEGTD
jgi:hypothetical protein